MRENALDPIKEDEVLANVLQKLGSKYEYIKFIGQGAFSKVYLLHDKILGEKRALKIMDPDYILQTLEKANARDIEQKFKMIKTRFTNEAKLYNKMNHPNIIRMYEVNVIEDNKGDEITYIIMQFVEGKSLKDILNENSPLEVNQAIAISKNILSAVGMIHENNIIHRDIKPSNIMIDKDSNQAIIVDFGLARDMMEATQITAADRSMGTPIYMSPEQCQRGSKIGPELDIYSVGILLYEMLTGEVPYKGTFAEIIHGHLMSSIPDLREKNPLVPRGFQAIIKKALAKEPKNRYQNAGEFLNDLEEIEHDLKIAKTGKSKEKQDDRATAKALKPKRKISKYFIYFIGILAVLAASLLIYKYIPSSGTTDNYKANFNLAKRAFKEDKLDKAQFHIDEAKKIKDTFEVNNLEKRIKEKKQLAAMEKDFYALEAFLKGEASTKDKIAECRKFLDKYKNIPQNVETKKIISQVNQHINRLEVEIKKR